MRARLLGVAGLVAIALLLVSGAGAGGTAPKKIDLSSPAAIDAYLRSVGVDPATVVRQAGLLNYAGPNCPGVGWNCTTATKVVQVATPGGQNRFECEPEADQVPPTNEATNTCVIAQMGDNNKARCKLRNTEEPTTQTCTVGQDGVRNSADIDMTIEQKAGPTQDGKQTANVDQTATERNQSQIHQTVKQQTSTGTSQMQDAYQLADVHQDATGSENFSHVHQSQDQNESGNATTQDQNTAAQPSCVTKDANQCALVLQDNAGGKNKSHLHQAIGERESTKALAATQTQGDPSNGNEGDIHQDNPIGVGENKDHAHQVVAQRESGPNGTTSQKQDTDPSCCGTSAVGGEMSEEALDQESTQSASEDDASQFSTLFGQVHEINDPANTCTIDHHGRNNTDSTHESVSGTDAECIDLFLTTTCTSGVEGGCSSTTTPPCDPYCDGFSAASLPAILSLPTSPTFGSDIPMPDYDGEPADYVDPGGWW